MRSESPYNPLDKRTLGVSVADALLAKTLSPISLQEPLIGAGIYAIYYNGDSTAYQPISLVATQNEIPIYVGKAMHAGARKGGFGLDIAPGRVLYNLWRKMPILFGRHGTLKLTTFCAVIL
jgi:hypothetical protein